MVFPFFSKFSPPSYRGEAPQSKLASNRGFTLTELIVVIAIMIIISGIVIGNYRAFDSATLLTSLAYDVALSVREAQVYGISVRSAGEGFNAAYGVNFDPTDANGYTLFSDFNDNEQYDPGEEVKHYTIRNKYEIKDVCGGQNGSAEVCGGDFTSFVILFKRPNPDAIIVAWDGPSKTTFAEAGIFVGTASSPETRTIVVYQTGQISVQNPTLQ